MAGEAVMSEPQVDRSTASSQLLRPGEVVDGRYRIEAFLGGGGMATVYRATHVVLEQPVALKVVSKTVREVPGVAARFIREARAATSLKGTHVARVFDVGTMPDGAPYMVMEYLEGRDLGDLVERGERPAVEDAVDWILQACEALAEVHGRSIVHRDLKPANLFLTTGPDGLPCVKLIDFGISRVDAPLSDKDSAGLTQPEAIMGSPRYMSPETMESATNADARSDIWGLGACLYELLLGRPPYDAASMLALYLAAKNGPPEAPSALREDVPEALSDAVLRCLRAEPSERWPDVAQLAAALAPFAHADGHKRAAAVARVLGATGRRTSEAPPADDEVAIPLTQQSSHVRRRVERAPPRRRGRLALLVAAGAVLAGVAALGSWARVRPVVRPTTPETTDLAAPPAAAEPEATPSPTKAREPAPPPRSNVDARRRRAPRHAPPPVIAPERSLPPPPAAPAPSPSPDDGRLFEDRK